MDRDDKSDEEVGELLAKGVKTSKRRHIECYLLDDELIRKLCLNSDKEELIEECLQAKNSAIEDSISRGNPADDIKSASGHIFTEIKRILGLTQCGNNKCAFLRDTMAPLITEDTQVYRGGPTSSDRLAAKLSYKLLVCVMPLILFFVRSVAECSPRPEEQNLLYYKPHPAFVHQTLNAACCGYKI